MGSYKYCLCFTRKFRWSEAAPPPDVVAAFAAYANGGDHMGPEQLRRFLAKAQGESGATLADAERIIGQVRQLRHRHHLLGRPLLALDDFHHFLFSDELNPPIQSQVHQDMTAPLSHYYIYTGHNSYLTGNQLSSDCSDVPIIKALQMGVRVIELDVWPNSAKDNVDVLHGRTLTSPVELTKCLRSIRDYAFCASPYPLVITLEDHLTPDLQAKVAEMATQTFGDMLYYPETDSLKEFPSPDSLKNKIIISTKPPQEYLKSKNSKENDSQKEKDASDEETWGKEVEVQKSELEADDKNDQGQDEEDSDDDDDQSLQQISAPEYKRLITIHAGKPKGGLRDAVMVDPDKVRRLSLSEQQFAKAAASHGTDVVRFTQQNLLRIYPKGTRFTSSNYKPLVGWMHGAQMVAFNMQGYGRSLWLMHGFFRANGGCGYIKKPDFLLKAGPDGQLFDPKKSFPVKTTLKVKVYMGDGWRMDFKQTHFDAYSPPDFYTKVGIAGVPADTVMKKTRTIEDDWTPVWDEEFSFPLTVPELAVLRIEVCEYDISEKDDFGGQTCLPASELRSGIRAVPLCDRKGMKFKSVRLLMRFEFV
ncbi:phosphoinositide phospholipase C 6 isoform X1 [Elaeis guineensis]|uniref:Phosphoinositide phospholipase C n=2 Tax=Elaeis guineensis var. tenera TaxID=51953 RepID=A0A6I9R904_ELAGV|nr:phosphoinositide phospholipase C 6 isoform X3 [Elaeis guineensis]